uniref:Uncharacterized protein n=1 Tax=Attheya septentrionalis TaxID=420275 RepID=A0A7S2UBJ5_9STRA|mmetsp:Transcript_1856/g.3314  ORF Transcript_1856/g.3314 Transcript_1856/m.3314 type:complete len:656 (+) Transcript_1856:1948-3915(+)
MVDFSQRLLDTCRTHLEHEEPRVRTLVAKVVGAQARYSSTASSGASSDLLGRQRVEMYASIGRSLRHHLATGRAAAEAAVAAKQQEASSTETTAFSASSTGALDDTTGWRALETNLQGIASYIHGCGASFLVEHGTDIFSQEDSLLETLEYCSVKHINRHVRAAGIACLEQVVQSCGTQERFLADPSLQKILVQVLKVTLGDNWSQVRMAGSVLCRTYLTALASCSSSATSLLEPLYPVLLPRMCLNRFYLAQGVKLYSHETWFQLFQTRNGMEAIAKHAGPVCRYYIKMCDADNHVVREAACQAVAELAQKLGSNPEYAHYLAPFVPMLLQALLMCFHDESWPVRDEACLACGTFCKAYPEECRPELPTLFSRWTEHLTDQIWSVREDAAVALGDAMEAYGPPMVEQILDVLRTQLPSAKDQPPMTREEYKQNQNDIDSHSNSQLYSCGSLAPKLRKGGAGRIGCSDCAITRPKAPWEATDGCIYLLREVIEKCTITDAILLPLLTELADICRVRHFPQADDLRTTLWKNLVVMARALGKQRFKRIYLDLFLDLLMQNLDDRGGASQLSIHAAGQCAEELSSFVGINIFRGRLEEAWQQDAFDRAMQARQGTHGSMRHEAAVSPFGPPDLIPSMGNRFSSSSMPTTAIPGSSVL